MGGRTTAVIAILIIQTLIFNLAFGVAAIVISSTNVNPPPPCALGSASYLSLGHWLLGFGVANVVIFGITVPLTIVMEDARVLYQLWTLIVGLFSFAWMIVGSVALWRDDGACKTAAYALWACSAACVISYYIGLVVSCITGIIVACLLKKK